MKMTETILKVENLNVKLDDELIICNLSFEVKRGEVKGVGGLRSTGGYGRRALHPQRY
jgi:ABC-type uncharacterized transport system ATPase subunit